jgi:hypothetical protein
MPPLAPVTTTTCGVLLVIINFSFPYEARWCDVSYRA